MTIGREIKGNGFSLSILGRAGMQYSEGPKTVFVDSEMMAVEIDFEVYTSSIQTWEGSNQVIASDEKQRILANIKAALASEGFTVEFR